MSVVMRLKQARNPEQIAQEIEPIAESLALLVEQTEEAMKRLSVESQQHAMTWSSQQQAATDALRKIAASLKKQTDELEMATRAATETAQEVRQDQQRLGRRIWMAAILSALFTTVLSLASQRWLLPQPQPQITLDAQTVAQYLSPSIIQALKKR